MLSSAGQPVKDPQVFAKTYAKNVSDVINKHLKERDPELFERVVNGAEGMAITDRPKDFTS